MPNNARELVARNRWHAAWLLVREAFRHPNTGTVIRLERR